MAGKMSLRRQRAGSAASSFFEAHLGEIGSAVGKDLLPYVREGERPADFEMAMRQVGRMIEDHAGRVIRADRDHLDERDLDIGPRLELEEAATEVKNQLVNIRHSTVGLYGKERANEILATDGPTAKAHQPVLLWRQGKHTVERLRSADFKEPEKKGAGMSLDPKAMADKLEPAVDRLYAAYQVVALERRKLETTVDGKKETFSEFDRRFRAAVRFGVAMCLLADEQYLASKLNTAQLQRRRSSASGEESPSSPPDEGSPPSTSPSPPSPAAKSGTDQPQ